MPIIDIFSKRRKRQEGEAIEVFTYDDIPRGFRVQVVHILRDALGDATRYGSDSTVKAFKAIHDSLAREYEVFTLWPNAPNVQSAVFTFMLEEEDHERVLDVIELSMRVVDGPAREYSFRHDTTTKMTPDDAIEELNARFFEHDLGYQFESRSIIRVDTQFIHAETVKPALQLLTRKEYEGANEEFLNAHKNYRRGRYKECLADSNKALESVLKSICEQRGWTYQESDTAKRLLDICFDNRLIPPFLQSEFTALRSSIQSGVPTTRNRLGGHGQGAEPKAVPAYLAKYILGLSASSIVLLVDANDEQN